jgi:hypothetical protein
MRIHLMIGPPGSGITALAARLVGELKACGHWAALVTIPDEAFDRTGDGLVWRIMHRMQGLHGQLAMVIDGGYSSREQRLRCMRRFDSDWPIEWVGWRLPTPLASEQNASAAQELMGGPAMASIEEGFSAIVNLNPRVLQDAAEGGVLEDVVDRVFEGIDACCAEVLSQQHRLKLHAYSRLIDFDRLMRNLAARLQPPPPDRRAALRAELDWSLDRLINRAADLYWLLGSGPLQPRIPGQSQDPIRAPEPNHRIRRHRGGWHRHADAGAFQTFMEELRLFLQSDQEHPHQPSQELQELIDRYGLQPLACASRQDVR